MCQLVRICFISKLMFELFRCGMKDRGCITKNKRHNGEPVEDLLAEKTGKLKQWQLKTRKEVLLCLNLLMISPLRAITQNYAHYTMTTSIKTQGQFDPTMVTNFPSVGYTPIWKWLLVCLGDWGKLHDPNFVYILIWAWGPFYILKQKMFLSLWAYKGVTPYTVWCNKNGQWLENSWS